MRKKWVISEKAPSDWQAKFPNIPQILRQLLWIRGVKEKDEIETFLHPSYEKDLHDPFLFKDMEKVLDRVFVAMENKEKIFVYGDYDADGIPGSAIIKLALDKLGAVTGIYIPHREKEGYGINKKAVEYIEEKEGKIIITCDCGISNAEEVDYAMNKGIDVIITDHHRIPEVVPKAFAILHPLIEGEKYPNKNLTGGGVAFKLAQALIRNAAKRLNSKALELPEGFEKWFLDLAAISTVADVGKLVGENRTITKFGLIVLKKTQRIGLQKLIETAGIKSIDTFAVGWQISPRINAAGRMDHANIAFELLVTDDEKEAERLAEGLNSANKERQKATDIALKEARAQIGESTDYLLSAFDESWNAGVIGLVAGRLMDEFQKPVIIGTKNEQGMIIASARSVHSFNVVEALAKSKQFLEKFGGHPKAAGFSVSSEAKWKGLIKHLEKMAKEMMKGADIFPQLDIDSEITISNINWEFVGAVQSLEPTGEGNKTPRFALRNLQVIDFAPVGNGGGHLRLTVTDESRMPQKLIAFRFGSWRDTIKIGDHVDVVVEIGVNEWNGNREIQLKVMDMRFSE